MTDERFDDEEQNGEENFAEMLEQSLLGATELEPGKKIDATVLQIGDEWVFLDVGQKGEGVLAGSELLDAEGNMMVAVGDKISAYFLSRSGGELRFTTKLGGGTTGTEQLEDAFHSGIPVEGRCCPAAGSRIARLPRCCAASCRAEGRPEGRRAGRRSPRRYRSDRPGRPRVVPVPG